MIHCLGSWECCIGEPPHRSASALSPPSLRVFTDLRDIKRTHAARRERERGEEGEGEEERTKREKGKKKWVERKEKSRI